MSADKIRRAWKFLHTRKGERLLQRLSSNEGYVRVAVPLDRLALLPLPSEGQVECVSKVDAVEFKRLSDDTVLARMFGEDEPWSPINK